MTLPCHTSLFLGVRPSRHGITTNIWQPQVRPVPGLFDVLHQAGLITAFFYNWEVLRDLSRPESLNASFMVKDVTGDGQADTAVSQIAANWLSANPFNFTFVYMGGVDVAGHAYGWMSDAYLQAIHHADQCVQHVLSVLPEDCTVIVISDHGGHEQTHGTDSDEDMTIPLIINGPAFPAGRVIQRPVEITDIAPTIVNRFAVPAPEAWIGSPVNY